MAVIIEKRNDQYFENRKRRHKKILTYIIISFIVITGAILTFVFYQLNNIHYTGYIVEESTKHNDGIYTSYMSYNNGVLRYSKDGAMSINQQGKPTWNTTYDMHNPIPDVCGDYLVISDIGNRKLELFNGSGHVNTIEVLHPIIKAEVASQGVVAVLMDGGELNYIQLYSQTGKNLIDSRTTAEKNGFVADFSLSDDGQKLVTSHISVHGGLIQSKITFLNFGSVGQNYEARVVGGFDYGQTLVAKVEFINNDTVSVFGDDKFGVYSMEEIPSLLFEKPLNTEVKGVAYNEKYVGIIQKNIVGDNQDQLTVYNIHGDKEFTYDIPFNYNRFDIVNEEIVFWSESEVNILRINGQKKFGGQFDTGVTYVFPISLKNEYLIINQSNMDRIKLVKLENQ